MGGTKIFWAGFPRIEALLSKITKCNNGRNEYPDLNAGNLGSGVSFQLYFGCLVLGSLHANVL